jgi:phage tail tape-measure protein
MNKLPYIFSLIVLLNTAFGAAPARAQWSPQAKGAVIGAGSGAVLGAVINKRNRAVGGVVGGVVGGAAGYGIGKHVDNKRKERARIAAANRAVAARDAEYRRSLARTQRPAAPTNSLAASAAGANAPGNQVPAASNGTYLPNEAYGNSSNPYATSEYRRKSW